VRRKAQLEAAIDYLRKTRAIRDVIISGGDPLTVDNDGLEWILAQLRTIPHLEIIRFGTRFPVVLPQRIDEGFVRICDKYGPIWLNTHFNHPNEITPEAARATRELLRAGVPVNNQCVLLRGINDTVETQLKLSHELMKIRVRPYYLFHADDVSGTEHLRTPVETGIKIIEGMRGHTSGLAVPTFVVDVPGGGGKIPLMPNYVMSWTEDEVILRNYEGLMFRYRNPRPAGAKSGTNGARKASIPGSNGKANGKVLQSLPLASAAAGSSPRLERRKGR
jgi:lysine 2,3-aminomutase